MRFLAKSLTLVVGFLVVSGCASGSSETVPTDENVQVEIMQDSGVGHFHRPAETVAAGGTVVWTNNSKYPHNVVFDEKSLKSSPLFNTGETYSLSFPNKGTFVYRCTLHPTMVGNITVN
jgi:plastocyanin